MAAGTGDEGGCERIVISTCCSRGDVVVLTRGSVSAERARMLLLPLSRRGRLRVKLGSPSSTGSRRGGDAGPVVVVAVSSAAAGCARSWSRAVMVVAMLQAPSRLLKAWLAAQGRAQAGEAGLRASSFSGTGSNARLQP
jgi:hypothetical protein